MTSEFEEIILDTHRIDPKGFAPDNRQTFFHLRSRRDKESATVDSLLNTHLSPPLRFHQRRDFPDLLLRIRCHVFQQHLKIAEQSPNALMIKAPAIVQSPQPHAGSHE